MNFSHKDTKAQRFFIFLYLCVFVSLCEFYILNS